MMFCSGSHNSAPSLFVFLTFKSFPSRYVVLNEHADARPSNNISSLGTVQSFVDRVDIVCIITGKYLTQKVTVETLNNDFCSSLLAHSHKKATRIYHGHFLFHFNDPCCTLRLFYDLQYDGAARKKRSKKKEFTVLEQFRANINMLTTAFQAG